MKVVKTNTGLQPAMLTIKKPGTFITRSEKRTNALVAKLISEREKKSSRVSKAVK